MADNQTNAPLIAAAIAVEAIQTQTQTLQTVTIHAAISEPSDDNNNSGSGNPVVVGGVGVGVGGGGKTPRKRSCVWRYFEPGVDKKCAKCKECGSIVCTSGNTSNLRVHLRRKHPHQWKRSELEGDIIIAPPKKKDPLAVAASSLFKKSAPCSLRSLLAEQRARRELEEQRLQVERERLQAERENLEETRALRMIAEQRLELERERMNSQAQVVLMPGGIVQHVENNDNSSGTNHPIE